MALPVTPKLLVLLYDIVDLGKLDGLINLVSFTAVVFVNEAVHVGLFVLTLFESLGSGTA